MPGLIRKLWRIVAGLVAGIVILLAVLVGLVRLALVQVPEYRDQIETLAGEVLGWPVEVGEMDARLGLRGPELRFTDARLLTRDRQGTLVVAATGAMQFESLSLLRGELRPGAVRLAGVALRIERNAEGRWQLLGAEGPGFADAAPLADRAGRDLPMLDDLPDASVRLEDLRVEFEDLRREAGPRQFLFDALELQLDDGTLALSAEGTLPAALGAELSLSLTVTAQDERGRPRDWRAGATFAALDLRAIGEATGRSGQLPATGIATGSVSAAADSNGLMRVAGELLARDLRLPRSAPEEDPVVRTPYDYLGASFEWKRNADGWEARVEDLDVERDDRRWNSAAASVLLETAESARRIEARADHVELADLAPLFPWLPPATRDVLERLAPSGTVRELEAYLDLPAVQGRSPEVFVQASFDQLSLAPVERWPGIRNLSGQLAGDRYNGTASLDARDVAVEFPWLFRNALVLATAEASLDWRRDEAGLRLGVSRVELANEDAVIDGTAALTIPADESSPRLEIDATARNVRLVAAPAYLPVGVMPDRVVAWLDGALRAGRVGDARFTFSGATRAFPFRDDDGLFRAEFDIADGVLSFDPGWPEASAVDAHVRFENEGLWAEVRSARLLDVAAGPAKVEIPDLAKGMLAVTGEAQGTLSELREFVLAARQLEAILGAGLRPGEFVAGRAAAKVDLSLPLKSIRDFRARVDLGISSGIVEYGFLGAPFRDIEAQVSIDNARVTASGASATLAGRPILVDVGVADGGAIRVEGGGRMDAASLAQVLRMPLDRWVSGESEWTGHLQFPAPGAPAPVELELVSPLRGFVIDLPDPLRKAADDDTRLQVRAEFAAANLVDWDVTWDDGLQIAARVDSSGSEAVFGSVPGAIEGEPPGMVFSGTIRRLDVGAWFGVEVPEGLAGDGLAGAIAGGSLLVGELTAPTIRLSDALVELSRAEDHWRLELAADRGAGWAEIPFSPYGTDPVMVRLERLVLDTGGDADPEAAAPAGAPARLHPAKVPGLDVEIQSLLVGPMRLGSISARVLNDVDGIELIGLEGIGESFMFQAEGRSLLSDTVDESRLSIKFSSEDVGKTLQYMGFKRSMEARDGEFEAEVTWQGGLRSDWLSAIEGDASILIRDGKLVNIEPGAGRVFGLLSIQALPRRLALDFKDVFGEGTSFDRISGDFRFTGGDAFTDNLLMRGPSADMVIAGRTGLVARDYDQTAVIAADLGRTLPVAGVVVAGPAVGAALFLLSEVLRDTFQAQVSYRITGPMDNPVVEKLTSAGAPARSAAPEEAAEEAPEGKDAPEPGDVPPERGPD